MTPAARTIWDILHLEANSRGVVSIKNTELVARTGLSEFTVSRALNALRHHGHIKTLASGGGSKTRPARHAVLSRPEGRRKWLQVQP